MNEPITNRYEFVLFFDVENGNPNGDPDAGNMPRIDPQTGFGIVTDVCLKRKVRNFVEYAKTTKDGTEKGYDIYVTEGAILNNKQQEIYEDNNLGDGKKAKGDTRQKAQELACERFYDVRTFGAVMDTGEYKCGQIRGPVQIAFARSLDRILQQEITITRMAATTDKENQNANRTMGRKYVVPYALYRAEGFISAKFAEKTGFSEDDLKVLWEALENMFEQDRSASHGKMSSRKLFVFKHDCALGNAHAQTLFDLIRTEKVTDNDVPPRGFADYKITASSETPAGVELIELL
jgi:CRISPR-associated protein Csd2